MIRALSFLGVVVSLSTLTLGAQSEAQAQERGYVRSISVSGQCLRTALPDRGSITVTADNRDKNLQTATKKTTESYEELKKAVQKLGLKNVELQTSEYVVDEIREWEKDKSVFKGYRARMGLQVTTSEFARLGEVIAIASNQSLKEVGSLRTFLSDEKNREERTACLEEAIGHAQIKAAKMAKAAGAKLGRVLQLQEEGASNPQPPTPMYEARMLKSAMNDAMPAPPSVDAANQKISLSIQAVYSLE